MLKVKEYSSFEAFEQDEHRQDVDLVAIVNKPNGMVCADLITDCKMWQTAVNRFMKKIANETLELDNGFFAEILRYNKTYSTRFYNTKWSC